MRQIERMIADLFIAEVRWVDGHGADGEVVGWAERSLAQRSKEKLLSFRMTQQSRQGRVRGEL